MLSKATLVVSKAGLATLSGPLVATGLDLYCLVVMSASVKPASSSKESSLSKTFFLSIPSSTVMAGLFVSTTPCRLSTVKLSSVVGSTGISSSIKALSAT